MHRIFEYGDIQNTYITPDKQLNILIIIICDKKGVYEFYFASCINIIFNKLRQQQVKYDVYTMRKIKHRHHFYHILFLLLIYPLF